MAINDTLRLVSFEFVDIEGRGETYKSLNPNNTMTVILVCLATCNPQMVGRIPVARIASLSMLKAMMGY